MKKLLNLLFFLLAPVGIAHAEPAREQNFAALIYPSPPVDHIQLLEYPPFEALEEELKHLIYLHGDTTASNHFCVVGYQFKDGHQEALVVWSEPDKLIRWHGHSDPLLAKEGFQYANSLAFSQVLALEADDDGAQDNTEALTVTQAQNDAIVKDCQQYGKHYRIGPFTPPTDV